MQRCSYADESGGATVVRGEGLVVSRGYCLFVCYHVLLQHRRAHCAELDPRWLCCSSHKRP